jgi:hypothetical protein
MKKKKLGKCETGIKTGGSDETKTAGQTSTKNIQY